MMRNLLVIAASLAAANADNTYPSSSHMDHFLIVGMTDHNIGSDCVNLQNGEFGADQDVLSTDQCGRGTSPTDSSFPTMDSVYDQRWVSDGSGCQTDEAPHWCVEYTYRGQTDCCAPAATVDWSGNIAVTSHQGQISVSNTDLYGDLDSYGYDDIAILAAGNEPVQSISSAQYFPRGHNPGYANTLGTLPESSNGQGGVGLQPNADLTDLKDEIQDWADHIKGYTAEYNVHDDIEDRSHKENKPFLIELLPQGTPATGDADWSFQDKDGDGKIIIDVTCGGDWKINNADVIIVGDDSVTAIFRVRNGANMLIDNSSIQRCQGSPGVLFAVGVDEANQSGDAVMGGSNAVLNNVVFWELVNGSKDTGKNTINCQNCQGCSQFIADIVLHTSTSRFNKCAFGGGPGGSAPDPAPKNGGGGNEVCRSMNLDFNGLPRGEYVTDQFQAEMGATLSCSGSYGCRIFDTAVPFGEWKGGNYNCDCEMHKCSRNQKSKCGDPDLGAPNHKCPGGGPGEGSGGEPGGKAPNCKALGNILIVDENGPGRPPDDKVGGTIVFAFENPINAKQMFFLEVDKAEVTFVTLKFADERPNSPQLSVPNLGDNGYGALDLSAYTGVSEVEVYLSGSGSVSSFEYDLCTEGEPAKAKEPASEPRSCHTCENCFTCESVEEMPDGSMEINVGHCKDGSLSWMCCSAVNGRLNMGDNEVCDIMSCDGTIGGPKCEGVGADTGMTISVPQGTTNFEINTHDGKTAGDALNVREVCGGPRGGQGGSCLDPATGTTAHCKVTFDIAADCPAPKSASAPKAKAAEEDEACKSYHVNHDIAESSNEIDVTLQTYPREGKGLFKITISDPPYATSANPVTTFGWCIDYERRIDAGVWSVDVFSAFDKDIHPRAVDKPLMFPNLAYLINKHNVGDVWHSDTCQGGTITWNELQGAAWILVDNEHGEGTWWDNNRIDCISEEIAQDARDNGKTYELECTNPNEQVPLVMVIDDVNEVVLNQTIISETNVHSIPGLCNCIDDKSAASGPKVNVCVEEGDSYNMKEILKADYNGEAKPGDVVMIGGLKYTLATDCLPEKMVPVCVDTEGSYTMEEIQAADVGDQPKPGDVVEIAGVKHTLASDCEALPMVKVCVKQGGSYTMEEILAADAAGQPRPGDLVEIQGTKYTLYSDCEPLPMVEVCAERDGSYNMELILAADVGDQPKPGDVVEIAGVKHTLASDCKALSMVEVCVQQGGAYTTEEILAADAAGQPKPGDVVEIQGTKFTLAVDCKLLKMVPVCLEEDGSYAMQEILETDANGELRPGDEIVLDGVMHMLSSECDPLNTVAVCVEDNGSYTMEEILASAVDGQLKPGDGIVLDGVKHILSSECDAMKTIPVCVVHGRSYTMEEILEVDADGQSKPGDVVEIRGTKYTLAEDCELLKMVPVCLEEDGTYTMEEILEADADGELKPGDDILLDGVKHILSSECDAMQTVPVCVKQGGSYTMEEILAANAGDQPKPGDVVKIRGTKYTLATDCDLLKMVPVCVEQGGSYTMQQILESDADGKPQPGDEILIEGIKHTLASDCDPIPEPVPDPEPEPETTPKSPEATPPKKGSGSGDPHFKTWTGEKYDYHGECDLVLVENPSFSNGQGLKVHIRTTRVSYFSFIEKVAVQIGNDVLEFDNDVDNFLINGVKVEQKRRHHKTMLGSFEVNRLPNALSIRLRGEVHNGDRQNIAKIDLHARKNGFPAVVVDGGHTDVFAGSLGLLGDWETGKKLARDGMTEVQDHTKFALEWQVRNDSMLFHESRFPQYPTTCIPPSKRPTNRLGMSNMEKEAKKACAHWKEDMEDCIFDVIATQDIVVATEGHIVHVA